MPDKGCEKYDLQSMAKEEQPKVTNGIDSIQDPRQEKDPSSKKPRFTVIPVKISNEKLYFRAKASPLSRRHSHRDPEESSSLHSVPECYEAREPDSGCPVLRGTKSDLKLSLAVSNNLSSKTESCQTLTGVPASLVPVVLPKGTRTPPSGVPPLKNKAFVNPFARLGVVPHGVTIPPLHETTENPYTHVLNKLLLESEKNIRYGTSDGRTLKVMPSGMSSQLLESRSSIRDHKLSPQCGALCCTGRKRNEEPPRTCWRTKLEFLLSCIGACVGLGSFWRLPYLCLTYGRVAFLVPYFIILCLGGGPLLLAELFLGQFTHQGPVNAMRKICPLMQGVGLSLVVHSFFTSVYYSFIFSESVLALGLVLGEHQNFCNATKIFLCQKEESGRINLTSGTDSSAFIVDQLDHVVERVMALIVTLIGAWVVVYFSLWKSVRSIGKVTKVSATLPFLLIFAFVWRALTLPGATVGLQYLFTPQWSFLAKGEVWVNAAVQVLISLNVVSGSTVAFSSYNKFWNDINVDVWVLSVIGSFSSLLAVLVVFSGLGNIADESGFAIQEIDFGGADLALIVYPQILSKMPRKHLWASLFFLLLLLLGIDSQFASVEVIVTSVGDGMATVKKYLRFQLVQRLVSKHELLVLVVCLLCFVCSLPFVFQGDALFDRSKNFAAMNMTVLFLALCEVTALSWIYGAHRICKDIFQMTSKCPSKFYLICWRFLTPVGILALWVTSLVSYEPPGFLDNSGSDRVIAVLLGWFIAGLSILPVPVVFVVRMSRAQGSFREKLMKTTSSVIEPCHEGCPARHKEERLLKLNLFNRFSKCAPWTPQVDEQPAQELRRNQTSLSI